MKLNTLDAWASFSAKMWHLFIVKSRLDSVSRNLLTSGSGSLLTSSTTVFCAFLLLRSLKVYNFLSGNVYLSGC